ncbi:hypothetical protein ACLOJK_036694 [Asimina triloba]
MDTGCCRSGVACRWKVRLLLRTARGREVDKMGFNPSEFGRSCWCWRALAWMEDGRRWLLVLSAMEDEQLVVHHCCQLKKTKEMRMGWIDGSACGWHDGRL